MERIICLPYDEICKRTQLTLPERLLVRCVPAARRGPSYHIRKYIELSEDLAILKKMNSIIDYRIAEIMGLLRELTDSEFSEYFCDTTRSYTMEQYRKKNEQLRKLIQIYGNLLEESVNDYKRFNSLRIVQNIFKCIAKGRGKVIGVAIFNKCYLSENQRSVQFIKEKIRNCQTNSEEGFYVFDRSGNINELSIFNSTVAGFVFTGNCTMKFKKLYEHIQDHFGLCIAENCLILPITIK